MHRNFGVCIYFGSIVNNRPIIYEACLEKKASYRICGHRTPRSACVSSQSYQDICCLLGGSLNILIYADAQQRSLSSCTNGQTDRDHTNSAHITLIYQHKCPLLSQTFTL